MNSRRGSLTPNPTTVHTRKSLTQGLTDHFSIFSLDRLTDTHTTYRMLYLDHESDYGCWLAGLIVGCLSKTLAPVVTMLTWISIAAAAAGSWFRGDAEVTGVGWDDVAVIQQTTCQSHLSPLSNRGLAAFNCMSLLSLGIWRPTDRRHSCLSYSPTAGRVNGTERQRQTSNSTLYTVMTFIR